MLLGFRGHSGDLSDNCLGAVMELEASMECSEE